MQEIAKPLDDCIYRFGFQTIQTENNDRTRMADFGMNDLKIEYVLEVLRDRPVAKAGNCQLSVVLQLYRKEQCETLVNSGYGGAFETSECLASFVAKKIEPAIRKALSAA